jgi:hypothetical protein
MVKARHATLHMTCRPEKMTNVVSGPAIVPVRLQLMPGSAAREHCIDHARTLGLSAPGV